MVKKIIWTPEAEKSFRTIIEYLQENWSEKEIKKLLDKTNTIIGYILEHPNAFRSAGKEDTREALITKYNLLLYRVSNETLYLLYFWDTRRNPINKPIK